MKKKKISGHPRRQNTARSFELLQPSVVSNQVIYAYRMFYFRNNNNCNLFPIATRNYGYYRPLKIMQAHSLPLLSGTEGIYSFKTMEECVQQFKHNLKKPFIYFRKYNKEIPIIAKVAIWGKITEHEKGYRSEYAYPQVFYATEYNKGYLHKLNNKWMIEITNHPAIEEIFDDIKRAEQEKKILLQEFQEQRDSVCFKLAKELKNKFGLILETSNDRCILHNVRGYKSPINYHFDSFNSMNDFMNDIWDCIGEYYRDEIFREILK